MPVDGTTNLGDPSPSNQAPPSMPVDGNKNLGDPSPSNQAGLNGKNVREGSPQDLPEIEIMRDAAHDFHVDNNSVLPDQRDDVMEPDRILEEQIMKDKEASSPFVREMLDSGVPSPPAHQPHVPSSVVSEQARENLDLHISLGACFNHICMYVDTKSDLIFLSY